jgi:hypothetical protein
LPKWLKTNFTLAELLCCYFEQSILINYQYYLLYKQEISFLYYDKLEDLLDNIFKLVEFIGNANEKKVQIFQTLKEEEIKNIYKDQNLREIILVKKRINDYYDNEIKRKEKLPPVKKNISSTMIKLQKLFINGDLNFVLYMTFITDEMIFTEEDFIIKIAYDIINKYWKNKTAEDLLQDLTTNYDNNNTKKRKKKKKKKNKEKNEVDSKDINENIDKKENIINNNETCNNKIN